MIIILILNNYLQGLKNWIGVLWRGLRIRKGDTILVSHAAFAYMAKRYDFKQMSVAGISPEQEPSPKTIADIIDVAIDNDFKYIF